MHKVLSVQREPRRFPRRTRRVLQTDRLKLPNKSGIIIIIITMSCEYINIKFKAYKIRKIKKKTFFVI